MATWIRPGQALELRTGDLVITVADLQAGHVSIDVAPEAEGVDLVEPLVEVDGHGGFAIRLEARVPEAVL